MLFSLRVLPVWLFCTTAGAAGALAAPVSQCPDNFEAFAGTREPLACMCPAEATGIGAVWGMDVYTGDSGVCRAAVHAGVIGSTGGAVTVVPEPGRKAYAGVTRNGIQSMNYGAFESSFRFASDAASAAPAPTAFPPAPAASPAAMVCPDNFEAFAGTHEPLACTCSGEAAAQGAVWGMDVYTGDSGICRAAVHAGVIGAGGGAVTIVPEPGRRAYPGVTRNGVQSINYGAFGSSFRFADAAPAPAAEPPPATTHSLAVPAAPPPAAPASPAPASPVPASPAPPPAAAMPAAPAPAAPVQQPIAETLQKQGEVNLYVRFRTNSAELDPDTTPILDELLTTLKAQPTLNLGLIGHTDSIGGHDFNRMLSYRRAEVVRFWLLEHGIPMARLAIDGRGFDEPLADNGSEQGRAVNRRVQAKRLP